MLVLVQMYKHVLIYRSTLVLHTTWLCAHDQGEKVLVRDSLGFFGLRLGFYLGRCLGLRLGFYLWLYLGLRLGGLRRRLGLRLATRQLCSLVLETRALAVNQDFIIFNFWTNLFAAAKFHQINIKTFLFSFPVSYSRSYRVSNLVLTTF